VYKRQVLVVVVVVARGITWVLVVLVVVTQVRVQRVQIRLAVPAAVGAQHVYPPINMAALPTGTVVLALRAAVLVAVRQRVALLLTSLG
jgi:hypothetical protein